MTRTLLSLALLAACSGGSDEDLLDDTGCGELDTGDDCTSGDGGSGDGGSGGSDPTSTIPLGDAPPPSLSVDVYDGGGGGLLQTWTAGPTDTWTGVYQSGAFNLSVQTAGPTQISFTVFDTVEYGASWELAPFPEGGVPDGGTLVWIESSEGGQSASGTLTITAWHPTDSPYAYLASGTFEAEVVDPDDPSWSRSLRSGSFEWAVITTTGG